MSERLRHVTSQGLVLDVVDAGPLDGPVVIALHGFPQTSAAWAGVLPLLAEAGYRVLAPDQRGYSATARPQSVAAYTLDHLCADVLAVADAAGAEQFSVLGHDWGGVLAWTLAGTWPDRVSALAVVSTPHPAAMIQAMAGAQLLRSWYMGAFQLPWLPETALRAGGGALLRRLLRSTGAPDPEAAVRLFGDRRAATGAVNWYRALRRPTAAAAGRTRVPTLYVWSDGDTALGRRAAEATEAFVEAPYRFVVLEGVSHWVPEERPVELAELVLDHLRTVAA